MLAKILFAALCYFFSVVLMLLIMTFNIYVVLAIALGSIVSYIFFNIQIEVYSDESAEKDRCGCECWFNIIQQLKKKIHIFYSI